MNSNKITTHFDFYNFSIIKRLNKLPNNDLNIFRILRNQMDTALLVT